ncbi:RNA-binding protein [Sporobolomyces salmoneus]|uniref:RNA-binding protein n=1 Tax=Sporobolomyces salmoneus TaxID=183962 RepID=UPI0031799808
MEGYDDLYGDLYGDEEEQAKPQVSTAAPTTSTTTASTSEDIKPSISSPPPAGGAVQTAPIASLLANEEQLQRQKHQQYAAANQGATTGPITTGSGEPLHFSPGFAQQRQTTGGAQGGVRPNDMPEEGKMFIGGLNWDTTDDTLKSYFEQFGSISHCTIMRDVETGRSRGFAFLTFDDAASVNAVMAREHHLDGKTIDPKRAIPRADAAKSDKLFVRCLPASCTPESFRQFWRQFGPITDATLMMDKETGRHRGFGFVNYEMKETVEKVLASGPHYMDGNMLEVKRAQAKGEPRRPDYGVNTNVNTHYTPQPQQQQMQQQPMGGMGGMGGMGMNPMMMNPMMMGMGGGGGVINPAMQGGQGGGGTPFDPQAMSKFFNQMGWGAWNPMMMAGAGAGGGGMGMMNPAMMGGQFGGGMGMGGMGGMGLMGAPTGPSAGGMSPSTATGASDAGGGEEGKDSNTSQFTAPMAAANGGRPQGQGGRGGGNVGMRGPTGPRAAGGRGGFNAPSGPAAMRGGDEGSGGSGPQRGRDNNQRFNPYSR